VRIGNLNLGNNLFLAPMAGYTDLAFRLVAKQYGVGIVFTEMVSACGLTFSNGRTEQYLRTLPSEQPLSVQIFGADPDCVAQAAVIAQAKGAAAIDLNMGCPVRKVVKSGAGAALMTNPLLARKIMESVRRAVSIPLTVKLRSGWDNHSINCHTFAKIAEDSGINAIIIHPRTARQLFEGRAEWRIIREVKEAASIPVIGNGDVKTAADALAMEETTGCDGVMIGRAALGNPWIFLEVKDCRSSGTAGSRRALRSRMAAMLYHFELVKDLYDEKVGVNRFKAHMCHYLKGMPGARELRSSLCAQPKSYAELTWLLNGLFGGRCDHDQGDEDKEVWATA
jgi:tRNA-dihydrouridine synthase B